MAARDSEQLGDVLVCLQDWREQIAQLPDTFEHRLRCQVRRVDGAGIQLCPGERCGDRRMNRVGTQRVGGRRVAPDAVLRVVNRHAISPVRSTAREGNQVGVARRELLSHGFDPGADALEGVAGS